LRLGKRQRSLFIRLKFYLQRKSRLHIRQHISLNLSIAKEDCATQSLRAMPISSVGCKPTVSMGRNL
jgi:hypothetical protein